MAKLNLQSIGKIYDDILLEARSTNWFILTYEEDSIDTIGLHCKGDGGIEYIKAQLNENMIAFIYYKITEEDAETGMKAADFIHITFIGKHVKARERSRAILHRHDVHRQFSNFIMEYEAYSLDSLDLDLIMQQYYDTKRYLMQ